MPFLEDLAQDELLKRDGKFLSSPDLKEALSDLAVVMLDINEPGKIDKEQQKVLSSINTYFGEYIKEHLLNYDRAIPTLQQYNIIIDKIAEIPAMQKFVQDPDKIYLMGLECL